MITAYEAKKISGRILEENWLKKLEGIIIEAANKGFDFVDLDISARDFLFSAKQFEIYEDADDIMYEELESYAATNVVEKLVENGFTIYAETDGPMKDTVIRIFWDFGQKGKAGKIDIL